jgi:hypothetical protein
MAAGEQELGSSVANQTLATGEAFESELDGSKAGRPQIAAIQSEKTVRDSEWIAATRSGSTETRKPARASVRALSTWRCSVSVQATRRHPASVSITARDRVRTRALVHCSNAWTRRLKARLGDAARRRGKSCRIWSGP